MKTRITLTLSDYERYVIARYWGVAATEAKDQKRPRATRNQVRAFAHAAIKAAVKEQADAMRGRQKSTVERLKQGKPEPDNVLELVRPRERQPNLVW